MGGAAGVVCARARLPGAFCGVHCDGRWVRIAGGEPRARAAPGLAPRGDATRVWGLRVARAGLGAGQGDDGSRPSAPPGLRAACTVHQPAARGDRVVQRDAGAHFPGS